MSESASARDNFKLITGIGPAIERRLHEAGIVTFNQLAGLSEGAIAEQLQGLAGMSPERVREQEWIRQARELAGVEPLVEDEPEATEANGQHYATFTVELLLERTNDVRRTRVVHVQDRDTETWAGWDATRLLRFFEEQAAIPSTTVLAPTAESEGDAPREAQPQAALTGIMEMREVQVLRGDEPLSSHLVSREQPFDVRLVMDMAAVQSPPGAALHYSARLFAKGLRDGRRHMLGSADGETPADEPLVIEVPARPSQMTAGTYRLEAEIALQAPTGGELSATLPGALLQLR